MTSPLILLTCSPTPIEGFADDYAFLIRGLVDLYEAGLDESWLAWAEQLQEQQDALFWDTEGGAYFSSREDDKSIIIRMKEGRCCSELFLIKVTQHAVLGHFDTLLR